MSKIVIIGAGWSGLTCAYYLSKAGHTITLIEAAPKAGGRARSVKFDQLIVDNGQHICIGAYHQLRKIIRELGLEQENLFNILPLELITHGINKLHIKLPNIPAPYNLLLGILSAKNIPWRYKYQTTKFCYRLKKINFKLEQDCDLLTFLQNYHQSEFIINNLWEPLAVATMTTNIQEASAQIFLNILRLTFTRSGADSNWYLPATDLSNLLPTHIEKYLLQRGGQIIYSHTVKTLSLDQNLADHYVLAVPPWQAAKLVQPLAKLNNTYQQLKHFTYQPIITIYFEFADPVKLDYPMYGILGATSQWVFDRRFVNQPNVISVVISSQGKHQTTEHDVLAAEVLQELQNYFPDLSMPIKQKVIHEKRAAFTCNVAIQTHRSGPQTGVGNLWLTGDYLNTGLPATLEGALLSGQQTAAAIISSISPRSNQNC